PGHISASWFLRVGSIDSKEYDPAIRTSSLSRPELCPALDPLFVKGVSADSGTCLLYWSRFAKICNHLANDRSDRKCGDFHCRREWGQSTLFTLPPPPDLQWRVLFPRGRRRATARRRNEEESKGRFLILAGNAVRGEPIAHRGVFGRRGRAPFGE